MMILTNIIICFICVYVTFTYLGLIFLFPCVKGRYPPTGILKISYMQTVGYICLSKWLS